MYYTGRSVPQDDAEAVAWHRLAAENGHPSGQTTLGFMYASGRGVPQDDAEAVRWYRLAAEQGDASAPDADIERMKEIRDAARAKKEQINLEE